MTKCKYFISPKENTDITELRTISSTTTRLEVRVMHDKEEPENAKRISLTDAVWLFSKKYVEYSKHCAKQDASQRGLI